MGGSYDTGREISLQGAEGSELRCSLSFGERKKGRHVLCSHKRACGWGFTRLLRTGFRVEQEREGDHCRFPIQSRLGSFWPTTLTVPGGGCHAETDSLLSALIISGLMVQFRQMVAYW